MKEGYIMFIKKINVNSYRGLNNLEINFSQPSYKYFGNLKLSVIVGENGVGKSTLFKFLVTKFSSQNFKQDRDEPRGEIEYEVDGDGYLLKASSEHPKAYPSKVIVSSFSAFDPYDLYVLTKNKVEENKIITSKYIHVGPSDRGFSSFDNVIAAIMELLFVLNVRKQKYDIYYNLLNKIKIKRAEGILINYDRLREIHRRNSREHFQDFEGSEQFKVLISEFLEIVMNIKRSHSHRAYKSLFGNIQYRSNNILVPIDIFEKEILGIYLEYLKFDYGDPLIRDIIFLNETNNYVFLSEMSSGEITMLFRFLPLIKEIEDNSIILIDEPETHLHPRWTREFISYIDSLFSGYKVHVMIATHSPVIASDVPMECIIGLKNKNGCIEQYKPKDRTLGGDSSQLLLDVFELQNLESIGALKVIDKINELLGKSQPNSREIGEARQLYQDLSSTIEKYELYKMYKEFLGD